MKYITIGNCIIHSTAQICSGAVIGKPYRKFQDGTQEKMLKTKISKDVYIGYYTIIGTGSNISKGSIIDDNCIIESRVSIGEETLIIYKAQICNDVKIGKNCVIGGMIGERTAIGYGCRIFGKIVHCQLDPSLPWDNDESMEHSAIIKDNAFIGFNSIIIGDITIGRKAYVCAGTIVTKSVPDKHVAFGINQMVHYSKWKGSLRKSPFFEDNNE
ncbi:MAG: hypothetical protein HY755_01815 [Nitrospirae bacterium]|nr:hypothetical protein [Nitrospirota bacterium]